MRRNKLLKLLSLPLIGALVVLTSCEGPAGPKGANGSDGTDGVDGNAVCMVCHNLTVKNNVMAEYMTSGHAAGTTVSRGGSQSCGMCHSDNGFRETQYTGADTLAETILSPQVIQCQTCHDFHPSLDFENEP